MSKTYNVPDPEESTCRKLEEVRSRDGVWPADRLLRRTDVITEAQLDRARDHDKLPAYLQPYLPDVLGWTLAHFAGVQERPKRGFVFVFGGVEYLGVYNAWEPWVAGLSPELRETVDGLKDSTHATRLGACLEAVLGGKVMGRYGKPSLRNAPPSLFDGDESEEEDPPDHLQIERDVVHLDDLRREAMDVVRGNLDAVRISPAQALWLADEVEAGRSDD